MRPVRKYLVGEEVSVEGVNETVNGMYKPYRNAKPLLKANLGQYCSYCEAFYSYIRDLHVEHIQPKGLAQYAHLEYSWSNFLLSCATCNGSDNKDTKDVVLLDVHLPHLNNTFLSLRYKKGGVVEVNPNLTGLSASHAHNLLSLVGLDKSPLTSKPGDKRWKKRSDDWDKAERYLKKYKCGQIDVDTIIDLIKACGGWSVWFTVFVGEDDVLARMIADFPGTSDTCFDSHNHFAPVPRNTGKGWADEV